MVMPESAEFFGTRGRVKVGGRIVHRRIAGLHGDGGAIAVASGYEYELRRRSSLRSRPASSVSVSRRLDRLERLAPRRNGPRLDAAAMDAEIERLAAELEAREGPGAFAAVLAKVKAEFETARGVDRET